tara:strand:+ start:169 stop:735 length:567 start_codon:yes stop_codon:yes gene_type:complete
LQAAVQTLYGDDPRLFIGFSFLLSRDTATTAQSLANATSLDIRNARYVVATLGKHGLAQSIQVSGSPTSAGAVSSTTLWMVDCQATIALLMRKLQGIIASGLEAEEAADSEVYHCGQCRIDVETLDILDQLSAGSENPTCPRCRTARLSSNMEVDFSYIEEFDAVLQALQQEYGILEPPVSCLTETRR